MHVKQNGGWKLVHHLTVIYSRTIWKCPVVEHSRIERLWKASAVNEWVLSTGLHRNWSLWNVPMYWVTLKSSLFQYETKTEHRTATVYLRFFFLISLLILYTELEITCAKTLFSSKFFPSFIVGHSSFFFNVICLKNLSNRTAVIIIFRQCKF